MPLLAIVETLEADVRSKFQTKRRIEDCRRGVLVEVPFDCTIVKFLWREERVLEVMEVVLVGREHKGSSATVEAGVEEEEDV